MFSHFFGYQNEDYTFNYYGISHIIPIVILLLIIFTLYLFRNKIKSNKYEANIHYLLYLSLPLI